MSFRLGALDEAGLTSIPLPCLDRAEGKQMSNEDQGLERFEQLCEEAFGTGDDGLWGPFVVLLALLQDRDEPFQLQTRFAAIRDRFVGGEAGGAATIQALTELRTFVVDNTTYLCRLATQTPPEHPEP